MLASALAAAPAAAFAATTPAGAAASTIDVEMVVDFGQGAPATLSPLVVCLHLLAQGGAPTGSDALSQLASSLDLPPSTYGSPSPLMCTIDGYPSYGCGKTAAYFYWSYWHGNGGQWSYSNDGPITHTLQNGDVEGWRFQNPGSGAGSDPPPAVAPDFAEVCPPEPATTTTTTGVAPAGGQTGGSSPTAAGTAGPSGDSSNPGGSGPAGGTGSAGAPGAAPAGGHTVTAGGAATGRSGSTVAHAGGQGAATTGGHGSRSGDGTSGPGGTADPAVAASTGSGAGAGWLPWVLVLAIVGLAVAAAVVWRRRAAPG